MRNSIAAIVVAFAAGFIVVWVMKPQAVAHVGKPVPLVAGRPERNEGIPPGRAEAEQRAIEFLGRLQAVEYRNAERKALVEQLNAGEIPALLDELVGRAGILGLGYSESGQLKELLLQWYAKAPDAAFAWVLSLKNEKDRRKHAEALIEAAGAKDYASAVSMIEEFKAAENGRIEWPASLFENAAKGGADEFIRLCRMSIYEGDTASGTQVDFPPSFDFRKVLDELAATEASLGERLRIGCLPSNLLTEWAARDPQAAWEWLQQGKALTFNSNLDGFLKGYAPTATPEELGEFLAGVFDPSKNSARAHRDASTWLMINPSAATLDHFLSNVPADRPLDLAMLLEDTKTDGNDQAKRLRSLILQKMTPDQRVEAMKCLYGKYGVLDKVRQSLAPELQRLGHADAEVEQLLPRRK